MFFRNSNNIKLRKRHNFYTTKENSTEMVYTENYLKEKLTKELEAEVCEVKYFYLRGGDFTCFRL